MQELGHGCILLVQKAGALQISPSDSFTKRELIECARAVTEKVPEQHKANSDALLTTFCQRVCCSLLKCQIIHIVEVILICVCVCVFSVGVYGAVCIASW